MLTHLDPASAGGPGHPSEERGVREGEIVVLFVAASH